MLAAVICWSDSGNPLSEDLREESLTLRPESNASGPKSPFPPCLASVLFNRSLKLLAVSVPGNRPPLPR